MQQLQRAAALFCLACVGAELAAQLAGAPNVRKCIKALAGLYILTVLLRMVPQLPETLDLPAFSGQPVQFAQTAEQAALQVAEEQLNEQLRAECARRFGTEVQASVTLRQDGNTVEAKQVSLAVPAGCPIAVRQAIAAYVQQETGTAPIWAEETFHETT